MWILCIKDEGLGGSGLDDSGKFSVQLPAGSKDFFFLSYKIVHEVVSGRVYFTTEQGQKPRIKANVKMLNCSRIRHGKAAMVKS